AAAGEGKGFPDDAAAGLADSVEGFLEVVGVEDDERPSGPDLGLGPEPTDLSAGDGDPDVFGAVVGELPPERLSVEVLCPSEVEGRDLDVVDPVVPAR